MRIEGQILGFDEYMNLVLDEAEEVRFCTVYFGVAESGFGVVWHGLAWYCMVPGACYGMVWYGVVWFDTVRYRVVLYGTAV